jgi:hypothetical protein
MGVSPFFPLAGLASILISRHVLFFTQYLNIEFGQRGVTLRINLTPSGLPLSGGAIETITDPWRGGV